MPTTSKSFDYKHTFGRHEWYVQQSNPLVYLDIHTITDSTIVLIYQVRYTYYIITNVLKHN